MTKQESIIQGADDQKGSPYVYGAWGAKCTVSLRRKYAAARPTQAPKTYGRCQQLRDKNVKSSCEGCKYKGRLAFDCRGFVNWLFKLIGIIIEGQAVGSQWNSKTNWIEKGDVDAMPDLVCVVFIRASNKWKHVGVHVGGGRIFHCSGEVKEDHVGGKRKWTHYAIPNGLYSAEEIAAAHHGGFMRILKKGMRGEDVRELQTMLNAVGCDCGKADGVFGDKTEGAVKAFQFSNSLQYDGVVGLNTWNALKAATTPAEPAEPDQPELPEDADEFDTDEAPVMITYSDLIALLSYTRKMTEILEKALK